MRRSVEIEIKITHPELPQAATHTQIIDVLFIEAVGLHKVIRDAADVTIAFVERALDQR